MVVLKGELDSKLKIVTLKIVVPITKWDLLLSEGYREEDILHTLIFGAKQKLAILLEEVEDIKAENQLQKEAEDEVNGTLGNV